MSTKFEIEGATLEEAIRTLIHEAAEGDVDTHLRTRGYDPRATGITRITAVVEDVTGSDSSEDEDEERAPEPREPRSRAPKAREASQDGDDDEDESDDLPSVEELEEEADHAADFLEGLLDAMDVPGDLKIRILDEAAEVEVIEADSGTLIGRRGQTLEAIQELARCSLQREFQRRTNVLIDVEGYRARRVEKLLDKADEAIDEVLDTGEPVRLEPMDVFERKAVHQLVSEVDGVRSRSTGREPGRRVVIEPED